MKIRRLTRRLRQPAVWLWLVAAAATIGLLCYRLVSLVPGLAAQETALAGVRSLARTLWYQPLELPLQASRLFVSALSPSAGIGVSRLPSVLLGVLCVIFMYWVLKRWYGYRLAIFGSLLMATAPWFLHSARLATSDIVYPLMMVLILVLVAWWHQNQRRTLVLYATAIIIATALYVPGALWLLFGGAILERKHILITLRASRSHTALAILLGIVLLVPLGHALAVDWHIYRTILGVPARLPSPVDFIVNIPRVWQHILIGGYRNPLLNLGRLPIIDFLTTLSFIVGVYLYSKHLHAIRTKQILYLGIVATLLIALQGPASIMLILPIVVVLSTAGIGYLLHLWLKVFPRNPVARSFGVVLMGVVILFAVGYNLRNYYVAWPNNGDTRATFQRQL